jgi:hypothetical protein
MTNNNKTNLSIEVLKDNITSQGLTFKLIVIGEPSKTNFKPRLREIEHNTQSNR